MMLMVMSRQCWYKWFVRQKSYASSLLDGMILSASFVYRRMIMGPVVGKVNSAIHRIVTFLNFLKLFIYCYKPD